MGIKEKLSMIQQKMKAPKNLYNSFGKYNYRNAESILEAFKPFENDYKVALIVFDEIVEIGGKNYVKATAELIDCESINTFRVTAYAREPVEKKGMDEAQITGATSSYARKYALNGLFLLDDTKDADSDEYKKQEKHGEKEDKDRVKRIAIKKKCIEEKCKKHGIDAVMIASGNGYSWSEMTETQLENMLASLCKKFGEE